MSAATAMYTLRKEERIMCNRCHVLLEGTPNGANDDTHVMVTASPDGWAEFVCVPCDEKEAAR